MGEPFSLNEASRIIDVIDGRIQKLTRSGAKVEYTWGTVHEVASGGLTCSVFLYGETDPLYASTDFRIPGMTIVEAGDSVKVGIDYGTGDRWIDERYSSSKVDEYLKGRAFIPQGFVTSNTGVSDNTKWTRLMSGSISTRYADSSGEIVFTNSGSSLATGPKGRIRWRIKQQDAFGSQPYVLIETLDLSQETANTDYVMVITSDAGPTTYELWARIAWTYTALRFHPVLDYGHVGTWNTFYNSDGFSASLPAGTQYVASNAWVDGGAIRANYDNKFTVGNLMLSAKGTTVGHTADYIFGLYESATLGGVMQFGLGDSSGSRDVNLYRGAANVLKTDDILHAVGGLRVTSPTSNDGQNWEALRIVLPNNGYQGIAIYAAPGDSQPVFRWAGWGGMEWGPGGSTATDTNLYRYNGSYLKTDDGLIVMGGLMVSNNDAGYSQDGTAISGGSIEIRSANPFIDFKVDSSDYGARIIYDYNISDGMEFTGATGGYKFDYPVSVASGQLLRFVPVGISTVLNGAAGQVSDQTVELTAIPANTAVYAEVIFGVRGSTAGDNMSMTIKHYSGGTAALGYNSGYAGRGGWHTGVMVEVGGTNGRQIKWISSASTGCTVWLYVVGYWTAA